MQGGCSDVQLTIIRPRVHGTPGHLEFAAKLCAVHTSLLTVHMWATAVFAIRLHIRRQCKQCTGPCVRMDGIVNSRAISSRWAPRNL